MSAALALVGLLLMIAGNLAFYQLAYRRGARSVRDDIVDFERDRDLLDSRVICVPTRDEKLGTQYVLLCGIDLRAAIAAARRELNT